MEVIHKSVVDELKAENERLLRQSIFTQKYLLLLEKYRSCLIVFCNYCKCEQNACHKSKVSDLEKEYKSIANSFNENIRKDLSQKTQLRRINAQSRSSATNSGHNSAAHKQSVTFIKSPVIRDASKTCGNNNNNENKDNKVIVAKRQKLDISIVNKNCANVKSIGANNGTNNSKKKANANFVFGSALLGGLLPTLKSNPINLNIKKEITTKFHPSIITITKPTVAKLRDQPQQDMKGKRTRSTSLNLHDMIPRRKNEVVTNEKRQLIIDAFNKGYSLNQISRLYGVKYPTARVIVKIYQNENRMDRKWVGRKKSQLTEEQIDVIRQWVDINCTLSLQKLVKMCTTEWKITPSLLTIDSALKSFHYSIRFSLSDEVHNSPDIVEQRFEFAFKMNDILADIDKLFFIDQTNVDIYCRMCESSAKPVITARDAKIVRKTYSISCAICNDRIIFQINDNAFNPENDDFIKKTIEEFVNYDTKSGYIIMNGATYSDATVAINSLVESYGHELILLPPFSSFLNPIASVFANWKNEIQKGDPQSEEQLFKRVDDVSQLMTNTSTITEEYVKNFEERVTLCLQKESFEDSKSISKDENIDEQIDIKPIVVEF